MLSFSYALLATIAVSVASLAGAIGLAVRDDVLRKFIFVLVSISAGALFGDAFIHLIPEALEEAGSHQMVSLWILVGILFFFVLEKFLHWRHVHGLHEESKESAHTHDHTRKNLGLMVLIGDSVHNLIDGVIIATSFLVSWEFGVAATIAIILHEIPQEMGDFGLLLHAGFSKSAALLSNLISAMFSILGTITVFIVGSSIENFIPYALAFAAGGFVYIAGSDLVPELQKTKELSRSMIQVLSMIIGFCVMFLLLYVE